MEVWIITDEEFGNRPMIIASSREKAIQQLFDYHGYEGKDSDKIKYHGFEEHKYSEEENERSYIGYFTFDSFFAQEWETGKYHLYELTLDESQKITPVDFSKK